MASGTVVEATLFFALTALVVLMAVGRLRLRKRGIDPGSGGALLWGFAWAGLLLAARLSGLF